MIKLSSQEYTMKGVTKEFFWKELEGITVGQYLNPEFGYTTPHFAKFENIFAGRKTTNEFSIYLYKPKIKGFRTEILSKGHVFEVGDGIKIKCRFEIPFWSFLIFIILALFVFTPVFFTSVNTGIIFMLIGLGIYLAIIKSNHKDITKEVKKQFDKIEKNYSSYF